MSAAALVAWLAGTLVTPWVSVLAAASARRLVAQSAAASAETSVRQSAPRSAATSATGSVRAWARASETTSEGQLGEASARTSDTMSEGESGGTLPPGSAWTLASALGAPSSVSDCAMHHSTIMRGEGRAKRETTKMASAFGIVRRGHATPRTAATQPRPGEGGSLSQTGKREGGVCRTTRGGVRVMGGLCRTRMLHAVLALDISSSSCAPPPPPRCMA